MGNDIIKTKSIPLSQAVLPFSVDISQKNTFYALQSFNGGILVSSAPVSLENMQGDEYSLAPSQSLNFNGPTVVILQSKSATKLTIALSDGTNTLGQLKNFVGSISLQVKEGQTLEIKNSEERYATIYVISLINSSS